MNIGPLIMMILIVLRSSIDLCLCSQWSCEGFRRKCEGGVDFFSSLILYILELDTPHFSQVSLSHVYRERARYILHRI